MRILHVVHQYLPDYVGGTEWYTRWLAEAQTESGHQVAVFYRVSGSGDSLSQREDVPGFTVWAVSRGENSPTRRFLATFGDDYIVAAFREVLDKFQPGVIHLQHLMGLPAALIDEVNRRRIPLVVTLHDYWWVCANAQLITNYDQTICNGPDKFWNCAHCALSRADRPALWPALPPLAGLLAWRNRLLRQALAQAAAVIAPTQFVADWYAAHGIVAPIKVLPHGIPLPERLPVAQPRRQDEPLRVAYIGGLSPQKGVHVLVQAAAGLAGQVTLSIAGDEAADPSYVAQLRQLAGEADYIRFPGKLTRDEVWRTLAAVDIIAVPALWYESFSLIISEAQALGVPVIASKIGALAERVQDGVNGVLVEPGDVDAWRATLHRLATDPAFLAMLKRKVVPPKRLEDYINDLEAIYDPFRLQDFLQ